MKQLEADGEAGEIDAQRPAAYYVEHLAAHRNRYGLED
jgi:hypothetical protein